MKHCLTALLLISFFSCGKDGKDGESGRPGSTILGANGVSTGIEIEDISPGLACASGGVSIFTFRDLNSDGIQDTGEDVIKVKSICNGVNGMDGASPSLTLESFDSSSSCPQGGIKLYSSVETSVEVCNGINGINGENGLPGIQGLPGMNGTNGTNGADGANGADGTRIVPVQFCVDDKSTFPEYGLMIGEELFAVYFGTTPASPKVPQAFLTKLVAGQYQSTGGNNCLFEIK